jgi:hypothetical protein
MDRNGEFNLIPRLIFVRLTRMKVPALESRLTGLQNCPAIWQVRRPGKSKDQRKPSGQATARHLSLLIR